MAHSQTQQIIRFFCGLIMLVSVADEVYAQSSTWKKAHRIYTEYGEYEEALSLFKKDVEKKPNVESLTWAGNCYRMLGDRTQALEWYNKVLKFKNYDPTVHLYIAEILMQESRFDEAKIQLTEYKKSPYASPIAVQRFIAACDSGTVWIARAFPGELRNEEALNTPSNDWGVGPYGNGGITFCSDRKISINTPYESDDYQLQRVLSAQFDGNGWRDIKAFERPINGANYNAGPIAFFKDGVNFVESRSNGNPDIPRIKVKTVNNTGLHYSTTLNDGTKSVMPFDYNNVIQYCIDGPCLSPDEQTLYYSSNKPGGFGGFDLYYSLRNADGTWGEPQNCGANINTSGDEVYPSMTVDGTLYFASSGLPGMGGLDIFSAKKYGNGFAKPINLGYPINSGADDFSFLPLTKNKVLFSSNRGGGKGGSDIYSFTYDFSKPRPDYIPAPPVTMVAEAELQPEPAQEEKPAPKEDPTQPVAQAKPAAPVVATPAAAEEPDDMEFALAEKSTKKEPKATAKTEVAAPIPAAVAVAEAPQPVAKAKQPEPVVEQPEPQVTKTMPATAPQPVAAKPEPQPAPVATPALSVAETTPADEFSIRIETVDKNKTPLTEASIRLVENATGMSTRLGTDHNGAVTVNVALGTSYTLMASKEGYTSVSIRFVIPNADKKVVARLTLEPLMLNRDMRLAGLFYDNKRWNLKGGSEKELDKLIKMLNDNPRVQVEIKSYSSDNNNDALDQQLATRRARNILNYLAFKGVDEDRIYVNGYAMTGRSEEGTSYRTMYRLFKEGQRNVNAAEVKQKAAAEQRAKQTAKKQEQQKAAAAARKQQQTAAAKKRAEATQATRQQQQKRQQQQQLQRQQLQQQREANRPQPAPAKQQVKPQPKPQQQPTKKVAPPQPFESFEIKSVN